jgi:uncharacterized protein YjbI with pentapeptide repeats
MKGIKPFRLSFLTRPFQVGREHRLGIAVLAYFPLDGTGGLLPDTAMWKFVGERLGKDGYLDAGIPKSRSEVLVVGSAYVPGGQPAATCPVRVTVGSIDASLAVIGDRVWDRGVPTAPVPFTSMELTWSRAFGGPSFDKNPLGKGAAPVRGADGREVHALPNLEIPGALVTSPRDRPEPACFGPIDFAWPQRFGYRGTYDQRWLETQFPGFAADTDWRIWNLARPEQQQEAPFRGDEKVTLRNLHPQRPVLEAVLPRIAPRCFALWRAPSGEDTFVEADAARLTTLWLFPDAERGIVVFHTWLPIVEDDAADVQCLMVAGERMGEPPRSVDHYRQVMAKRMTSENAVDALSDGELMPEGAIGLGEELERAAELLTPKGIAQDKARKRAAKEIEESRAMVASLGLDPDEHGPQPLPPREAAPTLAELPELVAKKRREAEKLRDEAEAERAARNADAERVFEELGFDYDVIREEKATVPTGPPEFSAAERRTFFRKLADDAARDGTPVDELEHYATDPKLYAEWQELEKRLVDAYRLGAHMQQAAPAASEEKNRALRALVLEAAERGESLAGRNLTGVDLGGLELRGVDFAGALLESASFRDARLADVRFDDAVLAHARFDGALVHQSSFARANLGHASLAGVRTSGVVDLTRANLWKTSFVGAALPYAVLSGTSLWESDLTGTDLSGVNLSGSSFYRTLFTGSRFVGADLRTCIFLEVDVSAVDFGGACLDEVVFLTSKGHGARFVGAHMASFRLVHGCTFAGADFSGAFLERSNLRSTDLAQAVLSGARLDKADLSESNLEGAQLYRIRARDSLWMKTNLQRAFMVSADLMNALLQKADLRGTDLRGANLYGADLALVHGDAHTNVQDAIQDKVRYLPKRAS